MKNDYGLEEYECKLEDILNGDKVECESCGMYFDEDAVSTYSEYDTDEYEDPNYVMLCKRCRKEM